MFSYPPEHVRLRSSGFNEIIGYAVFSVRAATVIAFSRSAWLASTIPRFFFRSLTLHSSSIIGVNTWTFLILLNATISMTKMPTETVLKDQNAFETKILPAAMPKIL